VNYFSPTCLRMIFERRKQPMHSSIMSYSPKAGWVLVNAHGGADSPEPVVLEDSSRHDFSGVIDVVGNHVYPKVAAYLVDSADDSLTRAMSFNAAHKEHIEFDLVGLEIDE
jgi:hypothetical protein